MRFHLPHFATLVLALALAAIPLGAQQARPVGEVLQSADQAWGRQDYAAARAGYEEVVLRDSTEARALFRLAMLLSWRNELDRSLRLFRDYARLEPTDDDGRVAIARTLAWSGRYDEALATYDSVLARNPRHHDAALGAAQTLAWSGQLEAAIGRYESWISEHPDDAGALTGLAQAWGWSGRPAAARRTLMRAIELRPDDEEARTQLQRLDAELAPSLQPTITTTNDSDDNRSTIYVVESGIAMPWGARLVAGASYRVADLAAARGTAITLRAATSWTSSGGGWTIRGEAGGTRLDGRAAPGASSETTTRPLLSARVSGRLAPRLAAGIGVSRIAFDETAPLIIAGIAATTLEGDAELAIHPRLSAGLGGGITRLSGGSVPNERIAASGVLRWSIMRSVSIGAGARTFGYQWAASDGYFAPRRYLLAEGSLRAVLGAELGWGLNAEVGLGHQAITAFDDSRSSRFAQRANAALAYRPAPGIEWSVSGGIANVASPTTISSAEYRVWSLSVRGRLRLK